MLPSQTSQASPEAPQAGRQATSARNQPCYLASSFLPYAQSRHLLPACSMLEL